jgi:hypothetical protein
MKELVKLDLGSLGKLGDGQVQDQFDAELNDMLVRFNEATVRRDKDGMVAGSITITIQLGQFAQNQELSASVDITSKKPNLRQSRTNLNLLDGMVCLDVTPNPQQTMNFKIVGA